MSSTNGPQPDRDFATRYEKLVELGIALSSERNHDRLTETILIEAMDFCNADGGTLYLRDAEALRFVIVRNRSLGIALGGTTGKAPSFAPLALFDPKTGQPNHNNVATYVALSGKTVALADAYAATDFDFSGTRRFDASMGYRSKSFLTLPLLNHREEVVGVLQLINALDPATGSPIEFEDRTRRLIEALASQAAIAIDNQDLIRGQKNLLEAFIKVIAMAIDRKSPYTSGHCQRVPVLTEMLADAACAATEGPFRDFGLDDDGWYELRIAGWMHDCGKVTTPEHVVDKPTKLSTIHDRIDSVALRVEILKRDALIEVLRTGKPETEVSPRLAALDDDLAFLRSANKGGEALGDDAISRIRRIATEGWRDGGGAERPLLDADEVENLSIRRGTLTGKERKIINDHIVATIDMLEALPFPKHLKRVPEYAGGHHEKMDGTGYPRGLKREQMSVPARMMAIADIFEALTARDRPYKGPMKLSQAIRIMADMKRDHHVDPDLFDLFVGAGVYRRYAEKFLDAGQIDEPDVAAALAVKPRSAATA
jgi:HD-GYP domain-containing protein (c-di-GMP phosphodiesterase class II)